MKKYIFLYLYLGLLLNAFIPCTVLGSKYSELKEDSYNSIAYIENKGQHPEEVRFTALAADISFFFTETGVVMLQTGSSITEETAASHASHAFVKDDSSAWAFKLEFVGALEHPSVTGLEPLTASINWYRGDPRSWRTDIKSYEGIIYKDLWPGIDMHFSAGEDQLKYTFMVHPGADPAQIRLAYNGAELGMLADGSMKVVTPVGELEDKRPLSWQVKNGVRAPVESHYVLGERREDGGIGYGFSVGSYDHSLPLVIDPGFIVFSGLLGGSDDDYGKNIKVDSAGRAFIVGTTKSADFPHNIGTFAGNSDVFVGRLSSDGSSLEFCTILGGSNYDSGAAITFDGAGNSYITGTAISSDFPRIPSGIGMDHQGSNDVIVVKLNSSGMPVFSRYIGGSYADGGEDVALDAAGNIYIVGFSSSSNYPRVPVTQPSFYGGMDIVVTKLSADGESLLFSGYIGGSGEDYGGSIDVDSSGCSYITGHSYSSNYPRTAGRLYQGYGDLIVSKVSASGTALLYSGYIGGTGAEYGGEIVVDESGQAYVIGTTYSDDIPYTVGSGAHGDADILIVKIDSTGSAPIYLGYYGGSGDDYGRGIDIDEDGRAYISGETNSTDFPRSTGKDLQGGYDAFVARLKKDGSAMDFSMLMGGQADEIVIGQDRDSAGNIYIIGYTKSSDFPRSVGRAYQGEYDAFIAKLNTRWFPWGMFLPSFSGRRIR